MLRCVSMMSTNLQRLKNQALGQGFVLEPLSPVVVETVGAVARGLTTASEVAKGCGIARAAAGMRLKNATEIGLLACARPNRGVAEYTYKLTPAARRLQENL